MDRDFSFLAGAKCLVIGGGGFIGLNLCRALVGQGAIVQGFGRSITYPAAMPETVSWLSGDFTDIAALAPLVRGQDFVFHLVSASVPQSSNQNPAADLELNVVGTVKLLDLCREAGVGRVIFPSSGGTVYGIPVATPIPETAPTNPISSYGIGKLAIEKYLELYRHLHGLDYMCLRIANPYGPFQDAHRQQGVVAALIKQALASIPMTIWGTGEVVRDFIYIDDVVEALLLACAYKGRQRVMNIGGGHGLSITQIADSIEAALGRGALPRTYLPGRAADVPVNILDISLSQRELGWHPRTGWQAGLAQTLQGGGV
jgi:UDP-glucose 4-epimerase